MAVRLSGSSSGYTELDAPAVAGNNTIKMPASNGAAGQRLGNGATAGTLEYSDNIVSGTAQASTSGTSIDFTGIPSWVKRVTVMFSGVSISGTSHVLLQVGTSSGIDSASYISDSVYTGSINQAGPTNSTSGFVIFAGVTTSTLYGTLQFFNISGSTWVSSHVLGMTQGANYYSIQGGGNKTLSGTLDRIRITTVNGTDTFDAGTINIMYE